MFIILKGVLSCSSGGRIITTKNPQSKDDALEALDFIVNVLKEHEKDLDKLITELATVTDQMGDTGELSGKIEKIEEKINGLQKEVTNMVGFISGGPREALPAVVKEPISEAAPSALPDAVSSAQTGPSVIIRCKEWEDFQNIAVKAQTVSFSYKEEDKTFHADALKGNQVVSYSGALPKFSAILKMWLSKQLDIPEHGILEGDLAVS